MPPAAGWKLVSNDGVWPRIPSQLQVQEQVQRAAAGVQGEWGPGEAGQVRDVIRQDYLSFSHVDTGYMGSASQTCRRREQVSHCLLTR